MAHSILQIAQAGEDWLTELTNAITDPLTLLKMLNLQDNSELLAGIEARRLFALRVPRPFITRMRHSDAKDPLLQQVITHPEEFDTIAGFSKDPLNEQKSAVPGLLHKYHNRALLLVKNSCAVNCRYCFRRHFPYQQHAGNKSVWQNALNYIAQHQTLDEIIFSGGDPLMAKDHELAWLISALEKIPHILRLRIHTRLPIVIPSRITDQLCQLLSLSRLKVVLVTHINHPNEIDDAIKQSMQKLRNANVTLLNQSVLLKGINDDVATLVKLSSDLFDAGILPYYLHLLDRVAGAAHFLVDDTTARGLMQALASRVSGYLLPRLAREIDGQPGKVLIDIQQQA